MGLPLVNLSRTLILDVWGSDAETQKRMNALTEIYILNWDRVCILAILASGKGNPAQPKEKSIKIYVLSLLPLGV